jgi:hypothetical protein
VGHGTTATTTTVSTSASSVAEGKPVTLTAQVTPTAATGPVVFRDGGVALGTADLASGTATLKTSSLAQGTHQVTASYLGSDVHANSTSAPVTVTVTPVSSKQDTTTTLTVSNSSPQEGQQVTLTAHVSPTAAGGQVTFADQFEVLGQVTLSSGTAKLQLSDLSVGSHDITATYAGNANYNPSASDPETVNVSDASSTTTSTTLSAPKTALLHAPVVLTATVTPSAATGTVQFMDATAGTVLNPVPVPVSGGVATLKTSALGTGKHQIYAFFTNDTSAYTPSASSPVTVTVVEQKVPGAPRKVTAQAGHRRATVHWQKPLSPGAAPIQRYVVVTYRGSKVVKSDTTHGVTTGLTVPALKPGVGYRFKVYAVNKFGNGAKSAYTQVVKPTR